MRARRVRVPDGRSLPALVAADGARQDSQVMRRITTVMARPMSVSAIGTPSATTAAEATTASET
jgi:hypothetical protein